MNGQDVAKKGPYLTLIRAIVEHQRMFLEDKPRYAL